MDDKEILEYMKDNEENNYQLGISATLTTIIAILIDKGLTTQEEFAEIQKQCLEKVRIEQVKRMTDEEKNQLKSLKNFSDLFSGIM